jgi:hypothetical protein
MGWSNEHQALKDLDHCQHQEDTTHDDDGKLEDHALAEERRSFDAAVSSLLP